MSINAAEEICFKYIMKSFCFSLQLIIYTWKCLVYRRQTATCHKTSFFCNYSELNGYPKPLTNIKWQTIRTTVLKTNLVKLVQFKNVNWRKPPFKVFLTGKLDSKLKNFIAQLSTVGQAQISHITILANSRYVWHKYNFSVIFAIFLTWVKFQLNRLKIIGREWNWVS